MELSLEKPVIGVISVPYTVYLLSQLTVTLKMDGNLTYLPGVRHCCFYSFLSCPAIFESWSFCSSRLPLFGSSRAHTLPMLLYTVRGT